MNGAVALPERPIQTLQRLSDEGPAGVVSPGTAWQLSRPPLATPHVGSRFVPADAGFDDLRLTRCIDP